MKQSTENRLKRAKELEELKKLRVERMESGGQAPELDNLKHNQIMRLVLYYPLRLMRKINKTGLDKNKKVKQVSISKYKQSKSNDVLLPKCRPIIIAPNHVRKQDIELILEAVPLHMFLLSGDYKNVHGDIGGAMLEQNGVVYFDMFDPEDRKNVKWVIDQILSNNVNMLWFYEGSWNLSPNKIVEEGYTHIVQAAIDNNALVLPISFDMVDNKSYIHINEPIDYRLRYGNRKLSKEEKIKALDVLKEKISNGIYEIWDNNFHEKKDNIPEDYWEKRNEEVLGEWYFDADEIKMKHFKNPNKVSTDEAFEHLNNIEPNKNNAFLLSKRNHH